ncbi:T9SS-dependent choice-of-anchor J family protein [Bergeyella cardium]|uniref:T9SS-dependent choice-of-anchor J family protein n=1 Tax=Bergeyella cardium TaxID=1585976 RepID=UPI000EA0E943|nr:choice-of-anchor J domain-containing protein [Bergeyella cardium]
MTKSIFKVGVLARNLPIALCYLFASAVFAQNAEEIRAIQGKTDLKALSQLSSRIQKEEMSTARLQSKAKELNIPFTGEVDGKLYQLQGFNHNGLPFYYITDNVGAAESVYTSILQNSPAFNLQGDGITLREWDAGAVRISHQEFGGRAKMGDSSKFPNSHSTHVAGTMIASGIDKQAKGMAPKAELIAYDWTDDSKEMSDAATNGALLSNHSYGTTAGYQQGNWSGFTGWHWFGEEDETEFIGYGHYGEKDAKWDLISRNAPYYLFLKAAGNPRGGGPEPGGVHYVRRKENQRIVWVRSTKTRQKNGGASGFDCIANGGTSKNGLIIAAAHKIPGGYKQPSDVKAASFSAFGPTDDGRIKPDLAGIGVGVYSTNSTGDDQYTSLNGTSMASPNVTGSLALLQEHHNKLYRSFMKSATLKALAIHTANEAGKHPGPDYQFGWGLLNAYKAAEVLSTKDKYSKVEEATLNNNTPYTLKLTALGNTPLIVTIVWDDAVVEKLPDYVLNNRESVLVNDLDLRISDGATTFFPWVLDVENPANAATKGNNVKDNVEQVVIENPVAGQEYTITVSHKGSLRKNDNDGKLVPATSQDFSLIATGINTGVANDLALKSVSLPQAKDYTDQTPVTVEVENLGSTSATGAKLKYKLVNADTDAVEHTGEVALEEIAKGATLSKSFNVNLSKSFVNYSIEAEVEFTGDEVAINNAVSAKAYGIIATVENVGESYSYGFEEELEKSGWTVEDTDGNGRTWRVYPDIKLARTGKSFGVNFPNSTKGADDWLFSNPIKVKGGKPYRLRFYLRKLNKDAEESLKVFYGAQPDKTSMTNQLGEKLIASEDLEYQQVIREFTPTQDGIIYFGFHNKVDADKSSYAIGIDDILVRRSEGKPDADFKPSKTKANSYETIELLNQTANAPSQPATYEWSFSPNTIEYKDGTASTSEHPKVRFIEEKAYSVTLKAKNTSGEDSIQKTALITIKNTPTKAVFTPSNSRAYAGEGIVLINQSTGDPLPTEFEWTVSPSEDAEFINGTSTTSSSPILKFNKEGDYTISLKATSPHNANTVKQKISISKVLNKVTHLTATQRNNTVDLKWVRPLIAPIYTEGFELDMPADITVIDANRDGNSWEITTKYPNSGQKGVANFSSGKTGDITVDDWLITPKIKSGAEVLKYYEKHFFKERYDVYVVPAPTSGNAPTIDEIKNTGSIVYKFDAGYTSGDFKQNTVDIKQHTAQDFFVAFHHRTQKEDKGFYFALDDIQVGYRDRVSADKTPLANKKQSASVPISDLKNNANEDILILDTKPDELLTVNSQGLPTEMGVLNLPTLKGYEIVRNNVKLTDITDINTLKHTDTLTQTGSYTYDVYAVYSDGKKSDKVSVSITISDLSSSEVVKGGLKIYPNPSDGRFIIELGSGTSSLEAQVYDLSGKLIFKKEYSGSRADLNLTQYPKGVYLLHLTNNKGEKQTAKLIVQ